MNNAATSRYTLAPRFGNTASGKSLYTFGAYLRLDTSALDAKSYSLTGIDTAKPDTSQITGGFGLQGPLKIPHLLRNGPNIFINYQRTRNSIATTTPGLVPDLAERTGDLSHELNADGQPVTLYNPATGQPYPGNQIPVSPQAQALLNLYPLPNFSGSAQYNYQVPLVTDTHQDALNSNASKTIGRFNQLTGTFAATSVRASNGTLLGFVDTTGSLGLKSTIDWAHTFNAHTRADLGYQFSRQSTRLTPYWENRQNISGQAGITGNDQDPTYWGPPTLNFSGGLASLTDSQSSFDRNVTNGVSYKMTWNHGAHNLSGGGDLRRAQFNYLSQANARGTFSFTGAATAGAAAGSGSDVADFLLGTPDASTVAFGNPDKYLRQSAYDAFLLDDWRLRSDLTLNLGVRWEYGAPITELKNRLVNLDVAPGFSAIAPILASAPQGTLTGTIYPASLMRPDRTGIEPRIGLSWRPIPASSLVVSAGYGMTYDTSVYQGIALQMAQQAPLSKSLTVQNSASCPLTLANGFIQCSATTPETFGVDPNYRVGYVHTWNLKLQRDLPASLQLVAIYTGIKGTRGAQEFLPNTNPIGAVNPCPSCPTGFEYLTSNGNSTRESAQIQLRRRLHSGFTASVLYTFSKSIDDDSALGGQGATTATHRHHRAGLAQPQRRARPLHLRPAPARQHHRAVHHRHGHRRRNAARRLARPPLQGVDDPVRHHRRHRPAANPARLRHRRLRLLRICSPQRYECAALLRPRRTLPQPRRLHHPAARPVGRCPPRLHHRPRPVHPQRRHAAHLPRPRQAQSRSPDRRHKCSQSRYVFQLEPQRQQHPVRITRRGQRHAQPTNGPAPEVLSMRSTLLLILSMLLGTSPPPRRSSARTPNPAPAAARSPCPSAPTS